LNLCRSQCLHRSDVDFSRSTLTDALKLLQRLNGNVNLLTTEVKIAKLLLYVSAWLHIGRTHISLSEYS
jgi:hypothetical protein